MPVTITKKKIAPKGKSKLSKKATNSKKIEAMKDLVDVMGVTQKAMEKHQKAMMPLSETYSNAKAELLTMADEEYDAAQKALISTDDYLADIGMKGNRTSITDKAKIIDLLDGIDEDLVIKLISFKLTELKQYLTPTEIKAVTEIERLNARAVRVNPLT